MITLKRTPERLEQFFNTNPIAKKQGITPIYGIDGLEIKSLLKPSRLIRPEALQTWSTGAIGAAISHLYCWRRVIESQKISFIFEDDIILAKDWLNVTLQAALKIKDTFDIIFLGWNLNSSMRATTFEEVETTSLFNPAHPSEGQIESLINNKSQRNAYRLHHCFGLSSYLISPSGAEKLIQLATPLRTEPISLGRGLPRIESLHIDALLNNYYRNCKSFIISPPVALARNNPQTSLTGARNDPEDFGGPH